MKTRAAVLNEPNAPLQIEELELLPPQRGEVMVKLAASGVCHSDLSAIQGIVRAPRPIVLGHEGAGVVASVGEGVTRVKEGDPVILSWVPTCGQCRYCVTGRPHLCDAAVRTSYAGTMPDGTTRLRRPSGEAVFQFTGVASFSEYTVVPETALVPVRPDMPLEKAALVGCAVMTGVGAAINTARVQPGDSVAVIGCGGVGLNVIQGAQLAGAATVIAIDVNPAKLAEARRFGATHTIDAKEDDAVKSVRRLTDGYGVDYSFEVIGNPTTIGQAFSMIAKGGKAVVVGMPASRAEVSIRPIFLPAEERTLTGCCYGSARPQVDMPRLVDLYLGGRLKIDELITRRYRLEEINEAFRALEAGENVRGVILY